MLLLLLGCPLGVQVLGVLNKELSKAHTSNRQSTALVKVKVEVALHKVEPSGPSMIEGFKIQFLEISVLYAKPEAFSSLYGPDRRPTLFAPSGYLLMRILPNFPPFGYVRKPN